MKRSDLLPKSAIVSLPDKTLERVKVAMPAETILEICEAVRNGSSTENAFGRLGFDKRDINAMRDQDEYLDRELRKAECDAASKAEQATMHRDPLKWLVQGPGRLTGTFISERKLVNLQTEEPLRVAHAHLRQNVTPQKETPTIESIPDFSKMTEEELDAFIAANNEE